MGARRKKAPGATPATSGLQTEERRQQIAALLRERDRISVSELSQTFGVSTVAIRRDLEELASSGSIVRTRGGALSSGRAIFDHVFLERTRRCSAEKQAIARVAAGLIVEGDTVFLDAGSTTFEMARTLRGAKSLTILTISFPTAMELGPSQDISVVVLGGLYRPGLLSCLGPLMAENARHFQVNKVFLGAEGFTAEHGLWAKDMLAGEVVRAMLPVTRQAIVVADSSKLGKVGFLQTAPIESIHTLITDWRAPAPLVGALRARGLEVLIAEPCG